MGIEKCFTVFDDVFKEAFSSSERIKLRRALDDLSKKRQAQFERGEIPSIEDALQQDAIRLANEFIFQKVLERKIRATNAVVGKKLDDFIGSFDNPFDGMLAKMAGIIDEAKGARDSTDYKGMAIWHDAMAEFTDEIDRAGLTDSFLDGKIEKEIAIEKFNLSDPKGNPDGLTGNPRAKKIAETWDKVQRKLVDRLNRAGSNIKLLKGFVGRQLWDPWKLRKIGRSKFKEFMMEHLDHKRTFDDHAVLDKDKFLDNVYDALVSGVHKKADDFDIPENLDPLDAFSGSSNKAKQLSAHRKLHFKNGESWYEAQKQMGPQTLTESVFGEFESRGRSIALLEDWGTNPRSMFELKKKKALEASRSNLKLNQKIKGFRLDATFNNIDGTTRAPGNLFLARFGASVRAVQSMAKLGFTGVYSLTTDISTSAAGIKYKGGNLFQGYAGMYMGLVKGLKTTEAKRLNRQTVAAMDGMLGAMRNRFMDHDPLVPGMLARAQSVFFKYNGMNYLNDVNRARIGAMTAEILGSRKDIAFENLDLETRRLLDQYSISGDEWDVYRSLAYDGDDTKGVTYITLDRINDQDLSPDRVKGLLSRKGLKDTASNVAREYDNLRTKLRMLFIDQSQFDVPIPGAAENALTNLGFQPGTIHGEILKTLMQFKTFPFTIWRKGFLRHYRASGKMGGAFAMAHYMASTVFMGYMAMVAYDALNGKKPRLPDTSSPDKFVKSFRTLMLQSAQKGGGFGIYGDFLFGEFNRFGQSFLATAAGPTFANMDNVFSIKTRFQQGEPKMAMTEFSRLLKDNMPFANLWFTKQAVDYLFFWQLQEWLNPGYVQRMERRLMRDKGQEFIVPPSNVIDSGEFNPVETASEIPPELLRAATE